MEMRKCGNTEIRKYGGEVRLNSLGIIHQTLLFKNNHSQFTTINNP